MECFKFRHKSQILFRKKSDIEDKTETFAASQILHQQNVSTHQLKSNWMEMGLVWMAFREVRYGLDCEIIFIRRNVIIKEIKQSLLTRKEMVEVFRGPRMEFSSLSEVQSEKSCFE